MSEATLLDRSWKEDFGHEDGNYRCICGECKQQFHGHKRRHLCRSCANKQAAGHEAHMRMMAAENADFRWAIGEIDRLRNEIEASNWNDPRP